MCTWIPSCKSLTVSWFYCPGLCFAATLHQEVISPSSAAGRCPLSIPAPCLNTSTEHVKLSTPHCTRPLEWLAGASNSNCSNGPNDDYKVTEGRIMKTLQGRITTLTQWRYLNLSKNSFYILFPAASFVQKEIFSNLFYVRLKKELVDSLAYLCTCKYQWRN